MKRVDSDALGDVNRALGLTGAGSPVTELADGVIDQVLEIGQLARRGRTQGAHQGLFTAVLRNEHTDAETLSVSVDPYRVGTVIDFPPYPSLMPVGFDVWLLQASVREHSGGPSTMNATLSIDFSNDQQGWGVTDGGVIVTSSQPHRLALWNALANDGTDFGLLAGAVQPSVYPNIRLPRGSRPGASTSVIMFRSTSSVTVSYDCQLLLGVFPSALGQDGLG